MGKAKDKAPLSSRCRFTHHNTQDPAEHLAFIAFTGKTWSNVPGKIKRVKSFYTLSILSDFAHGFFCRNGGISTGLFASLNCQMAEPHYIHKDAAENFRIAQTCLNLPNTELHTIHLKHGNTVHEPKKGQPCFPEADASITDNTDIMLAVTTADCLPILLGDPKTRTVAALHVGWRGALTNLIGHTIHRLSERDITIKNLRAGIGPCIAQQHLKLNAKIREDFAQTDPASSTFFQDMFFDLRGFAAHQLTQVGVTNIEHLSIDTYTNEDFFSARRARHKGENVFGAQPSLISAEAPR